MTYKVKGYIIRKQDMREYDKIFTLYTYEQGKIRVMAQGVKKISSKLSGNLELLYHVSCTIAKGKHIDRLTTVDVIAHHEIIKNDIKKLICALYCLDIVDHLIKDSQQDAHIYELIGEMLNALEENSSKKTLSVVDAFLVKFRTLCGYGAPKRSEKSLTKYENRTHARSFVSEYVEKELKTQVFFDFLHTQS
jgi:DNA repair protein RecO (recombination protein O)